MSIGRRLATAALLVAAACGDGTDERAAPPAVVASVERDRLYDVRGVFELTFVNEGADDVEITGAALVTDLFERLDADERITRVPAGSTRSRPISYGAARCDEPTTALRLRYLVDGEEVTGDLGEASGGIQRLHAQRCAEQAIRDAVDVSFGDDWRVVEPTRAQGSIVLDVREGHDVVVEDVFTQIVFVTTPASSLPASDDVELVATAARCDAHALTESKKTFLFTLVFRIDGGEPARLELRATDGPVLDAMKQAIDDCVAQRDSR